MRRVLGPIRLVRSRFREEHVRIGGGVLSGVVTEQSDADPSGDCWLLVSSVGPGRTFVEFARREILVGWPSLRVDFSGWGTSDRRSGQGWGEHYSRYSTSEIELACEWLIDRGYAHVHVVGFCAGAVLRCELHSHLD